MDSHEVVRNHGSQSSLASHFTKTEVITPRSPEGSYYIEYIRHFERLSPDSQKLVIAELADAYHESITGMKFSTFVEEELYDKKTISVKILLAKDKETHKTIGFVEYSLYKIYYLPDNFTLPNTYFFTSAMICIHPKYRRQKMSQEMPIAFVQLLFQEYPNHNLIHFDAAVHPAAYYSDSQNTELILPNGKQKVSKPMTELMAKMMSVYSYKPVYEDFPFVIQLDIFSKGLNKARLMENFSKLPEEIKFYLSATGLRSDFALAFAVIGNMIVGNTVGLEPKVYIKERELKTTTYEIIERRTYKL